MISRIVKVIIVSLLVLGLIVVLVFFGDFVLVVIFVMKDFKGIVKFDKSIMLDLDLVNLDLVDLDLVILDLIDLFVGIDGFWILVVFDWDFGMYNVFSLFLGVLNVYVVDDMIFIYVDVNGNG